MPTATAPGAPRAWVHGPFKVQGEYMGSQTSRSAHDTYNLNSWYVSGVWNITGETWGYKDAVVTTGLPNEPASGMWQMGLRYDTADLNDGSVGGTPSAPVVTGVLGGKESNWTGGVNWYWRSNFKLALNYVWVSAARNGAVQQGLCAGRSGHPGSCAPSSTGEPG